MAGPGCKGIRCGGCGESVRRCLCAVDGERAAAFLALAGRVLWRCSTCGYEAYPPVPNPAMCPTCPDTTLLEVFLPESPEVR